MTPIPATSSPRSSLVLLPTIQRADPPLVTLSIEASDHSAAGAGAAFRILFTAV